MILSHKLCPENPNFEVISSFTFVHLDALALVILSQIYTLVRNFHDFCCVLAPVQFIRIIQVHSWVMSMPCNWCTNSDAALTIMDKRITGINGELIDKTKLPEWN